MSDSDNPSSPKKEEMDVSENGDTSKTKEDSDQEDSQVKVPPKEEDANEESEEEDDEEEPPLGLLERPVELTSGKREKKKVERLEVTINLPSSERKKVDIPEGKGTKLGDCPRIEFKLNHIKAVELKPLHRLLFNRIVNNIGVKKNIRLFNGFTFEKGDKEYDKRVASLNKMMLPGLKRICEVLDIERSGTKAAIVERIMDFLMKPSSSGLHVPEKKKRKSKGSGEAVKKGAKRKRAPKKKDAKSKASKDKDELSDLSDSDDQQEEEEEEEEEVTMKTVVKRVYEKYPSFDLTDRKDFIKTTVREIIS